MSVERLMEALEAYRVDRSVVARMMEGREGDHRSLEGETALRFLYEVE